MLQRMMMVLSAGTLLAATGLVHGLWTDRWSDPVDLTEAAHRLTLIPMDVDTWHGEEAPVEFDPRLGLAGMRAIRYTDSVSGKTITILVACGRPGPVAIHTPEVCYEGNGYAVEKPRRFQLISRSADAPPEFWTARMTRTRKDGQSHLRVFWSWFTAKGWRVADNPRIAFVKERLLYKLYLQRDLVSPDEAVDSDMCVDFMRVLLPELQRAFAPDATPEGQHSARHGTSRPAAQPETTPRRATAGGSAVHAVEPHS